MTGECPKCGKRLNKGNKSGFCQKHRATRPYQRTYMKAYNRRRWSGATPELVEQLREVQNDRCGICDKALADAECADHDHASGEVRGLLCRGCNGSLGWYEKNKERAQKYLDTPPKSLLV